MTLRRWHKLRRECATRAEGWASDKTKEGCEGEETRGAEIQQKWGWVEKRSTRRVAMAGEGSVVLLDAWWEGPGGIQAEANTIWFPLEMDYSSRCMETESEESEKKREGGQWAPFTFVKMKDDGSSGWGRVVGTEGSRQDSGCVLEVRLIRPGWWIRCCGRRWENKRNVSQGE